MRRSGWVLPVFALLVWIASVAWPTMAMVSQVWSMQRTEVEIHSAGQLLLTSIGWSMAVSIGAMILGWAPGRLLGRALQRRGFVPLAALMLVPICVPAYVVYFAWWQSWPADTAIYRWVVAHQFMQSARQITLLVAMLCWSWPLVAWCVAGSVAATPARREELLRLDGAGLVTRLIDHLRCDFRGLLMGGLLVFLVTLSNTTCFDLAEVFTFANELRAIEALGANPRDVLVAGLPAMVIVGCAAIGVWLLLASRRGGGGRGTAGVAGRFDRSTVTLAIAIWIVSVIVPLTLFVRNVAAAQNAKRIASEFFTLYSNSLLNTIGLAAVSGCVGAMVAMGLSAAWQDHRRWVIWVANFTAMTWLIAAVIPGTIVGVAIEAAYNRGLLAETIYRSPAILVVGHLASFGFVAALLARWIVMREPAQLRDLRRVDGVQSLRGLIESSWPRLLAASVAALAVIFVLAIGEIPVTAMINPPMGAGHGPLAMTILNDMHYQRPQTVMIATLGMIASALVALLIVMAIWWKLRRVVAPLACLFCFLLCGCVPDDSGDGQAFNPQLTFGVAGNSLGQFGYPRAIDVDHKRQCIYVVDKTARVQRFGFDGKPQIQWHMPELQNGKPTGVSVAPDGTVFVADTHYFRLIAYDPDGNELMRFGEYGREPGQFIYLTDVAFGPQGQLYVSEYGGNDRVQVFSPEGKYLFEFGSFGTEPGQFNRPQAITFNAGKSELFIADACNHRIVVVDPDGKFLRSFGSAGHEPGQFAYPYGVVVLSDGTLVVSEFGNNRIQHLDSRGKSLGVYGHIGRGPGELQYPWATAAAEDRLFVLDSGNNRVQVMRRP